MRFERRSFKKYDLKPGMVVLRRDGNFSIVNEDLTLIVRMSWWLRLEEYNDDLLNFFQRRFDILSVYKNSQKINVIHKISSNTISSNIDQKLLTLIWKRNEIQ